MVHVTVTVHVMLVAGNASWMGPIMFRRSSRRPGPIQGGAVNPYILRCQGVEPVTYDHDCLEPILRETKGVIVLQEQVLEVAMAVAGFTAGQAEYERRLAEIDARMRQALPVSMPTLEEAAALFDDLPRLWAEATAEEKRKLISPLVERAYVDMEAKRVGAITPTPAFRSLLRGALEHVAQPTCILVDATKEIDWAEWWRWWRRGSPHPQDLHHLIPSYQIRPEWGAYAVLWKEAA